MTNSYAIETLLYMKRGVKEGSQQDEAIDMAIKALEQPEPCEDAVSRQVALDHVDDVPYIKDHPNVGLLWKAWIEQLPSVTPKQRTGATEI